VEPLLDSVLGEDLEGDRRGQPAGVPEHIQRSRRQEDGANHRLEEDEVSGARAGLSRY
jgi:hypothetical protein